MRSVIKPSNPYSGLQNPSDIRSYYTSELAFLVAMRARYACQFCGTSSMQCRSCRELDEQITKLESTP